MRLGAVPAPKNTGFPPAGLLKKPRPSRCEKCGEVMPGVEHDEAISIYALHVQARRLLRRHSPSPISPALTLLAMTIPRFFNIP